MQLLTEMRLLTTTSRAAEAGFSSLSERMSRIEDRLTSSGRDSVGGVLLLDGVPPMGNELMVTSPGGEGDKAQYSAVGSKRGRLNQTAPSRLGAATSKKANRGVSVDKTSVTQFGSTTAIADAKLRYAKAQRRPIQQESTSSSDAAAKESSFDSSSSSVKRMELLFKGVDGQIVSSSVVHKEDSNINGHPYASDGSPASSASRRANHQVSCC